MSRQGIREAGGKGQGLAVIEAEGGARLPLPGGGLGVRLRGWLATLAPADREALVQPDRVARAGLLVWSPIILSLGIGLWFSLTVEPGLAAYAAAALLGLAGLLLRGRVIRLAARGRIDWDRADAMRLVGAGLSLAAAGFLAAGLRAHTVAGPVMEYRYYGPVEGRVVAIDRSARDRMRITLDAVTLRDTPPERTPVRVRLSLTEPQPLPAPGARVMLTGHLGPPPGPAEPYGFDFRRAAFFDGLGAVGYTRTPILTVSPPPPRLLDATTQRLRLSAAMQAAIGGQEGAVAAALMTGDRSGIAEATNQIMRDSNLYHIVSISGLHMSMLAGFVYAAIRLALAALAGTAAGAALTRRPLHKVAAVAALAAATAYLWLSGGGVPTERAYLMVAVMLTAILADRRALSLRTVAVAALAILVVAPDALVTPGFQMSFAATAALILLFPAWSRRANTLHWSIRWAVLLVISSLIAGLATTPIAAAHFGRMSQYGMVANLLVVPVMGVLVMPFGVLAAVLAPLGLASPALWVMGIGTRWMLMVGAMVAGWGGSVTAVPAPHWAVLPLMGGGATVLVLLLRRGLGGVARLATGAAAMMVVAGLALWIATPRPALLVAGDGRAVGLMTPEGRSLAKPAGAFVADSWLRGDGDVADAEAAALRPGWTGTKGARRAMLAGAQVVHLSGKGAADRVAEACAAGGVVVLAGRVGEAGRAEPARKVARGARSDEAKRSAGTTAELRGGRDAGSASPRRGAVRGSANQAADLRGAAAPDTAAALATVAAPVALASVSARPTTKDGPRSGKPGPRPTRKPQAGRGPCLLLDETRLARSGAMAAWVDANGLRWLDTREATGARLWTDARARRVWGHGGWRDRARADRGAGVSGVGETKRDASQTKRNAASVRPAPQVTARAAPPS